MELVKKIILSIITSLSVVLCTPFITQASPLVYSTERISGQDRVETALKISQKGWDSAQTVILCENSDYPDSIAATPFAVSLNAPILLTKGNSIDPRVVKELQRLKPRNVVLLGGTACLNLSIEKELEESSLEWERIGGMDRYETSILLAKHLSSDSLILANGDDFPDALSAATFAGIKQIPIVLTSTTLPESVIGYLNETSPKHIIVIGGEVVVPSKELTKNNFTIETRLGGLDRYETNAKVTSYMKDVYESNDLFLASGITFPDAVAGTVLASKFKAPLLITEQKDIPPSVYSLMRNHMKIEPPVESTSDNVNNDLTKGHITASGGLNLRETPSSTGKLLVTIPKDTTIDLINQENHWYKTTYQSKTGWVSADYVTLGSMSNSTTTPNLDLSVNGTVYILGGTGIISSKTQTIIEGKASSNYNDNLKDFPPLPSEIKEPTQPSRGGDIITPPPSSDTTPPSSGTPPVETTYDPSKEVLINPFEGIPANALSGKTIMLDPGHGGPDTGAVGPNHTYEKDNNLAIALTLNDILKQAGAKVILTRNNDTSPASNYSEEEDLQARMDLANKSTADLFISIHNDSYSSPDIQGTSTYYSEVNPKQTESIQLANSIQSAVIDTVKTKSRGLKEAGFYVLRKATMPAILLETAFISNPYEEARLKNPTFQKNIAVAIFHGLYNYYKNPLPKD
ncbi:N-acetylmuramoyl-L-alanine amidase [Desulfosporosinus sp. Sb-LF]|uniref:N-acetylmuramoyl-L-alanine amidase n=1 Tax=Desulfosporosinus sp. Sb-LF TaxID=2560027 RepID=UPI0018EE4B8D|nr:N-acetylmuramoyl-L-alanine amidase [Desulfosporosinus sp. Sb-LF]